MERLIIYNTKELDCAELYQLANDNKNFVIGERDHALTPETADETVTMIAIFVTSPITRQVLARMPRLRLIVCLSTGTDHVDLRECAVRGITVCNVPAYGAQTVAEYTMALMLALSRRLPEATTRLRGGVADHADLMGRDLAGRTLTVIGTGRIGQNVIGYARAFGMTVLGVDVYPNEAAADKLGFAYVGLHEGLQRADIISLHAPLTPDNKHLLNRRSLAALKPGTLVINTARGELIDTTALLHALHTGHLGGAALDVIEGEKYLGGTMETEVLEDGSVTQAVLREIAEHEALLKLPNVIITNHNAYNTAEARGRIVSGGMETVRAFVAGNPINVVNTAKK
ncbi:MAG TPA: NAD(P)-dependent oxidoreductase [Candidatus Saccharimonadia bacterium]|nr:NAD(P)-dependent oxidoreductase [Candidatus Saccharimonadia bacterium]